MKTTIKTFATMFLLFVTSAVFSMDPPSKRNVQILPSDSHKIKVLYVNPDSDKATIRIHTADGLFFSETIKTQNDGFLARYDLSSLESNEFWIEVSDEDTSTRYRVTQDSFGNLTAAYWAQPSNSNQLVASN
jgi:hypothetical protein